MSNIASATSVVTVEATAARAGLPWGHRAQRGLPWGHQQRGLPWGHQRHGLPWGH